MDQEEDSHQQERLPRGARRRARTRADLLVAARKVFATRGYHEATITEIAETADVGVGTFYLHFRDKDALFNTLLAEGLDTIRRQVVEEMARYGRLSLAVAIRVVLRRAYEERDFIRVTAMAREAVASRSRGPEMLVGLFMHFLEYVPDPSPFTEEEIPLLASLLSGLMDQVFHWWYEQDEPGPDLMADRILHVMQHGFPASLFEERQRPGFTLSDE